jgi:SAM-dependent methyltransferase
MFQYTRATENKSMKNLEEKLKQCGKPTGVEGKELAAMMNENHFPLITWGLEKVQIAATDTILDIGCGGGRTMATLAEKADQGRVYGIDHSGDCVAWSKEYNQALVEDGRVVLFNSGVESMPFEGSFFNLVTAVETIYFWPVILENFKKVNRVLKPGGGFLIINEMYQSEHKDEHQAKNDEHVATGLLTVYSPAQIKEMLMSSGFIDISIDLIESNNWLRSLAYKPI